MDEAIEWTKRFLEVLGQGECELRPIFEASDFPPRYSGPSRPHTRKPRAGRCCRMPRSGNPEAASRTPCSLAAGGSR